MIVFFCTLIYYKILFNYKIILHGAYVILYTEYLAWQLPERLAWSKGTIPK